MVTAANLEAAFLPFGEIADVSLPYVKGSPIRTEAVLIFIVNRKLLVLQKSIGATATWSSRIQRMSKMPSTTWTSLSSSGR